MNIKKIVKLTSLILLYTGNSIFAQTRYQKDFLEFWTDINNHYAYLAPQQINWEKVKSIYEPEAAKIKQEEDFIRLLEQVLDELYNGHASLNTNLNSSNRLVPSGSDLYVEKTGDKYLIRDLRKGFGADLSGLKIGMAIKLFNGQPIDPQIKKYCRNARSIPTPQCINMRLTAYLQEHMIKNGLLL